MLETRTLLKWILEGRTPTDFSHDWANANPYLSADRELVEEVLMVMTTLFPDYNNGEAQFFNYSQPLVHFNFYGGPSFNFIHPDSLAEYRATDISKKDLMHKIREQEFYEEGVTVGMLAYALIIHEDFKWANEETCKKLVLDFLVGLARKAHDSQQ